jgi:DNA-binding transcriptional regulator LsrR (DeoR family)
MKQPNPMSKYRDFKREYADEVRRLYFSRQMTQKQLAYHYKISQSTVHRIISDKVWIKLNAS